MIKVPLKISNKEGTILKHILIIGGGPGGYVGAIRASQLGAKVTLVEKRALGGTCLNRGCIPTKALYKNAEVIKSLKEMDKYGVEISDYSIDFDEIQNRKDGVVSQLRTGIEKLMKDFGITVLSGVASFKNDKIVMVALSDGEKMDIEADHIIIATGSDTFLPAVPGIDLDGVITSDELLEIDRIPESMVIAGGGVIGLEMGSIFNTLGSKVTIVSNRLLKRSDGDIVKRLPSIVKRSGIKFLGKSHLKSVERSDDGQLLVRTEGAKGENEVQAELLLVAIGRVPYVEGLSLEKAGITYDQGIKVNDALMTNKEEIYAIGDVIGGSMLAHVASAQAIAVVECIMGLKSAIELAVWPDCTFMSPQVASVGMTEEACSANGTPYKIGKFSFSANGKALSMGETEGFVKVIVSEEDETILGMHILGPNASDLIHEGAVAISNGLTVHDVTNTIHAHPTLAEAIHEAMHAVNGEALHAAPPKSK